MEVIAEGGLMLAVSQKATYSVTNELDGKTPSYTKPEDDLEKLSEEEYIPWGTSNNLPWEWEQKIRANVDLTRAIGIRKRFLMAGGITYKVLKSDGELSEEVRPEIELLLKKSYQYLMRAAHNFASFFNFFPELILNKEGTKVSRIACLHSKYFRYAAENKKSGIITKGFYQGDWNGGSLDKNKATPLDVVDPRYYEPELISEEIKERKLKKFVFPQAFYTGEEHYQWPEWVSVITSKWLELVNQIPKFKAAVMKNQITLKYHIEMPSYWMTDKYPRYNTYDLKKKSELLAEEVKVFEKFLSDSENSGKSLTSMFKTDPNTLKPWPGWKITPIDDKMKDGLYIEDGVEGAIKIYTAVGVDPAIMGILPGKNAVNRSGSERREAFNLDQAVSYMERELLLKPFELAADINGWNTNTEQVVFMIRSPHLQTLNQVTPSRRETRLDDEAL